MPIPPTTHRDDLFVVWGDTVDLRELMAGLVAGAVAGYVSFAAGVSFLTTYYADLQRGVLMGYALLLGVAGCVLAGAIAAAMFKPKRIVREGGSTLDSASLLRELRTDSAQEAEYLRSVPPDVIAEMRRLGILHLFDEREDAPSAGAR